MLAFHKHLRLHDGNHAGFLAQGRVASQGLRVSLDAASAGKTIAHGNHPAPLGKTGTHLSVFG